MNDVLFSIYSLYALFDRVVNEQVEEEPDQQFEEEEQFFAEEGKWFPPLHILVVL